MGCRKLAEGRRYLYEGEKSYNHTSLVNHLQHAIQLGFRFFDTAQLYDNEEILGKAWSKSGVNRSEFVFSSKLDDKKIPVDGTISPQKIRNHVRRSVNTSLAKLQTSYIDFFHVHYHHHQKSSPKDIRPIELPFKHCFSWSLKV